MAGRLPVGEITAPELLAVLRRAEARGAIEPAHRAHQNCGRVFRYAIATGQAERDPTADLSGASAGQGEAPRQSERPKAGRFVIEVLRDVVRPVQAIRYHTQIGAVRPEHAADTPELLHQVVGMDVLDELIAVDHVHRVRRERDRAPAIGDLLSPSTCYLGSFVTQCALKLALLTFVRPGELRKAEWSEIAVAGTGTSQDRGTTRFTRSLSTQ